MIAEPFPHLIVDGRWDPDLLEGVVAEFPHPQDQRWRRYGNEHEAKYEGPEPMWGPRTRELFDQFAKLAPELSDEFGIPDLSMETLGGGYHLIPPGGYLGIHTDFNRSPDTDLYRRLNLLTFLNRNWQDDGGHLELWPDESRRGEELNLATTSTWSGPYPVHQALPPASTKVVDITPELNRMVVFETSDRSWHGHPKPAKRWRLSVAAYFFSPEPPPGYSEDHSTVWA